MVHLLYTASQQRPQTRMKATRRARAEDRRLYTPTAPTGRTVAPHKDTEVPGGFEHTIFGPQASVFVRCHAAPSFSCACVMRVCLRESLCACARVCLLVNFFLLRICLFRTLN